jgi:hypothetical protein
VKFASFTLIGVVGALILVTTLAERETLNLLVGYLYLRLDDALSKTTYYLKITTHRTLICLAV